MLTLVGCNHRSAPVEFRERLAMQELDLDRLLERLLRLDGIDECMIISTCNRVEVIARGADSRGTVEQIKLFLVTERGVGADELDRHTYQHRGLAVARHLMRVASGLDSMILGEPQVLGQVKQSYLRAKDRGVLGAILERLCQQSLAAAKRIRTNTGIARHAVSVASTSVRLAQQIFGKLDGRSALLLGSGKMMHLVARHLRSNGVQDIAVSSRTYDHAAALARQCEGRAVHWDDGLAHLHAMDIIIACTAAPTIVLERSVIAQASRRRRGEPLFLIDLAVPRDIDPAANTLDNVYLYDIDGLQDVIDANMTERRRAAEEAEQRIEIETTNFDRWRQTLEITPTIVVLRERLLKLGADEAQRFKRRMSPLTPAQQGHVDEMMRALVQKILHQPVIHLRKSVERGDVDLSTSLVREIFGLDLVPAATDGHGADEADGADDADDTGTGPRRLLRGGKDDT
jgi:glutamyl-tRNA reductase